MGDPLARQAGNERRISSFCTVYATYVTSSADRAVHTGLQRRTVGQICQKCKETSNEFDCHRYKRMGYN